MILKSRGLVRSPEKLNHISNCRRPMGTKLRKVSTYCEKLPHLKSHDPLITRPTWVHATNWKNHASTFTKHMVTKFVLTSRRRFRAQTPKSSPTSCRLLTTNSSNRPLWTNWHVITWCHTFFSFTLTVWGIKIHLKVSLNYRNRRMF